MNLKNLWKRLNDYYEPKPKPTELMYEKFCTQFEHYDLRDMEAGISLWENNKRMFPTLNELEAFVSGCADHRRANEAKQENKEAKRIINEEPLGEELKQKTAKVLKKCDEPFKGKIHGKDVYKIKSS